MPDQKMPKKHLKTSIFIFKAVFVLGLRRVDVYGLYTVCGWGGVYFLEADGDSRLLALTSQKYTLKSMILKDTPFGF